MSGSRQIVVVAVFSIAALQIVAAPPPNDECEGALPIEVGSTVLGSTVGAAVDPVDFYACGWTWGHEYWPGIWYRVTGTGNRMTASLCNAGTEHDTQMTVFCADCLQLPCIDGSEDDKPATDNDCLVPVSCDDMTCTTSRDPCAEDADCPADACSDGACRASGDPCAIDEDCPPAACLGTCSVFADTSCGPGECSGLWRISSKTSWCSREGQEYLILVNTMHGKYGNIELSVEDDGVPCPGAADCSLLEVVDVAVSDNGDGDNWADSNETIDVSVDVFNRSGVDLTGVEATIMSDDPRIECIANTTVPIGDLPSGQRRQTLAGVRMRISDVDRADAMEDLAASLRVVVSSEQQPAYDERRCSVSGAPCTDDAECILDDICGNGICATAGTPCLNFDDCPSGDFCWGTCSQTGKDCFFLWDPPNPGQRNEVNLCWDCMCDGPEICVDDAREVRLDLDLDPVGGSAPTVFYEGFESRDMGAFAALNIDAGLGTPEAGDDWRCQKQDPDAPHVDRTIRPEFCYPGVNEDHADATFWQTDAGRAYRGLQSLYMGIDLGGGAYTTPARVIEAAGTVEPLNLGWGPSPILSFKHQVNQGDCRIACIPQHGRAAYDRSVVQVQVADATGDPVGPWVNLKPFHNVYSSGAFPTYRWYCFFDPTDDGNTEDDYFDPNDLGREYGPSSTCFPNRVWSNIGETLEPFDPANTGWAPGPGLEGETGIGTWIESRLSLWPYRGQRIRLRFLASQAEIEDFESGAFDPGWPYDEGWWIDDVHVTNTLLEPTTLVPDIKDNSALAVDADGDCTADVSDCDAGDAQVWSLPGDVLDLLLAHSGGQAGTTTLVWSPPGNPGGTEVDYTLLTDDARGCAETPLPNPAASDGGPLAPGELRLFLVRADNPCGAGTWGLNSGGTPRGGCS